MSEVSRSAEWSALEMTIVNKFGSGHGTTVLLRLLKTMFDAEVPVEPAVTETPAEPEVTVTESSP